MRNSKPFPLKFWLSIRTFSRMSQIRCSFNVLPPPSSSSCWPFWSRNLFQFSNSHFSLSFLFLTLQGLPKSFIVPQPGSNVCTHFRQSCHLVHHGPCSRQSVSSSPCSGTYAFELSCWTTAILWTSNWVGWTHSLNTIPERGVQTHRPNLSTPLSPYLLLRQHHRWYPTEACRPIWSSIRNHISDH